MSKEELIIPDITPNDLSEPGISPEASLMQGPELKPVEVNPEIVRSETTISQVEEAIANLPENDKKES